jgi:PAS domain S-box-containing protein
MERPQLQTATLDDVVITGELSQRALQSLPHSNLQADLQAENQALCKLARQLVNDQPEAILQSLIEMVLERCQAGSAGVSLLETSYQEESFRWAAMTGALKPFVGGTSRRNFSPCGFCLDRGTPQLFSDPGRYFTDFQVENPAIVEVLVLPLIADHHPLGTIWIVSHDQQRHFDSEDVRVMTSLADFTAAALLLNQRQTQNLRLANAKLEAEVIERRRSQSQRNQELQLLSETSMRLLLHPQPEKQLSPLLNQVASVLGLEFYFNYLVIANGPFLRLNASLGIDESTQETLRVLEFGQAVCGTVAQSGRAIAIEDVQNFDDPCCDVIRDLGIQAYLCHPLIVEDQLIGTLSFGRRSDRSFEPEEINLLRTISDQVAMALHRTRLVADLRNQVSERRRAEESARESEAYFRAIADLVPDLLWRSDSTGNMDWCNQRWFEYTGQTRPQLEGDGWLETIHPEDRAVSFQNFQSAIASGHLFRHEHRIRNTNGSYRWFLLRAQPVHDAQGQIIRWFGAATDIQEQRTAIDLSRNAEAAIRQREAFISAINNTAQVMITLYDRTVGKIVYANDYVEPLLGFSAQEISAMSREEILGLVHSDDLKSTRRFTERSLTESDGEKLTHEYRLRCKNGEYRWLQVNQVVFERDENNVVTAVLSAFTDVHDRKCAEQSLLAREQRLSAIFAQAAVGLCEISIDGCFEWVNDAFCRVLRRSRQELLTVRLAEVLHPEDVLKNSQTLRQLIETGEPVSFDERYLRPDQTILWVNSSLTRLDNEQGEPRGVLMVAVDLSDRKQAEAKHVQLIREQAARLEAERVIQMKDEFLATVSHELQSPLVSILGWTRLLRTNPSAHAKLPKHLETIERNAILQAKLIADLLDMSRLSAGRVYSNFQPVDLNQAIEAAIETVSQTAETKGVDLIWQGVSDRTSETLPQNANPVVVMADQFRLQQVMVNLLINSVKFTPESGSIKVKLFVVEAENAAYAEICVTDTGIGISADFLPHIFDRFRQAENSGSARGLGLGLAIARHLVKLHNGTIYAESPGEGQGATFRVRLPLLKNNLESNPV